MMNEWGGLCSQTALIYAANSGHLPIVEALLSYPQIDVNAKVCSGTLFVKLFRQDIIFMTSVWFFVYSCMDGDCSLYVLLAC